MLAATTPAASFELTKGKELEVLHGGKALIANDSLTYGDGWQAGKIDFREKDGMTVINTFQKDSKVVQYRREIGVGRDRVELTCQFRMFPYNNTPDKPSIRYTFRIPFERLRNTTYKIHDGRAHGPKIINGKFGSTSPDVRIAPGAHYAAFKGDDVRLVIDLNPKGLSTNMDYGGGGFIARWLIEKRGDYVEFSCGYSATFYGGTYAGKALIYEGEYEYSKVHAYQKNLEIGGYQLLGQYHFGDAKAPKGWRRADLESYDGKRKFGWENPNGIAITQNSGKALTANAAHGTDKHAFIMDVTPGIYAVNLRIGGIDAGPFDVALNGKVLAGNVTVRKGHVRNVHLRRHVRADKLKLEFSGKKTWAVSTIILQPLIYQYEDFAFDRGPWLVEDIFTPEG